MGKFINQNLKQKNGFSVIELLIYIALVAVITIIFTNFTADVVRNSSKALVIKEVNQSARLLIAKLSQDIKTAKQVTIVNPGQIDLIDPSNNPLSLYFDSVNKVVMYDAGSGPAQISSESVRITNLEFNQTSPRSINIKITVEQKNINPPSNQYKVELSTIVTPRPALY